ncbi:MAG: tRNA guanosine(34) transglycosylase Tgt [bacterium (Candidatus Stahlbacteria) CG23_combo_of_CG06-09_8_20_14_all_34_7]|nr:MAG: tRNA guanosine(34) transglycosylase Tgt [bacterium (Candidatus Stahlbacteria) CG23_combo_of_CG06-09_8_20_14_all_34_7]
MNIFTIKKKNKQKRRGEIKTAHGIVETPNLMIVATQGTVKAVSALDLKDWGSDFIVANSYHLYLRPGLEVLKEAGGLHKFMNWTKTIFTDSGGFQVFSLSKLRKFKDEGIIFQSHIDGSLHSFTPENNVQMQRVIGGDVMMVLDECMEFPVTYEYAKHSVERTVRWAEKAREEFLKTSPIYGYEQSQFGIIQGSTFEDLRKICADKLIEADFDGYAMGGVAIGESKDYIRDVIDMADGIMPEEKCRYLMGVGEEDDVRYAVEKGFDIFDCVIPTRNARNGALFTKNGRILIKNAKYKKDFTPVEDGCECHLCKNYSRAYLHHLFNAEEILGGILATEHNINYYMRMMKDIRDGI